MKHRVGDIVQIKGSSDKKLIVNYRDEVVPRNDGLKLRTVYKLAGRDYARDWFTERDISVSIPKS